jgi:hypothetical protein
VAGSSFVPRTSWTVALYSLELRRCIALDPGSGAAGSLGGRGAFVASHPNKIDAAVTTTQKGANRASLRSTALPAMPRTGLLCRIMRVASCKG